MIHKTLPIDGIKVQSKARRYDNCYPRIDGTTNIGGTYIDFQVLPDPHELGNQLPKWPAHLHGVYWQHAFVLVYYQHIFLGFFSLRRRQSTIPVSGRCDG